MLPPPPSFDVLRLAAPADILRFGVVATCGARDSSVFDWECPYHEDYPEDTILEYRREFPEFIRRTDYIVLVVDDKFEPDESKKSKAIIAHDHVAPRPEPGEEVIVGVACWNLWPGSHRRGQFQNNNGVDIKGGDIVPTGLSVSLMEYVVKADTPGVVEL
ncbi:hypothetical protein LTS15_001479 [Exophiala xenobiotica]|nr:hypothetical protein LTS15_001479 [Exophiala xenobiotica]